MTLDIKGLIDRAREYVEVEADTKVVDIRFEEGFTLFGQEDVVLSVRTTDKEEPDWWVVGGSTPINLYTKKVFLTADEAYSMHTGIMIRLHDKSFKSEKDPPEGIGYDAFICHSSEDKDSVVRPIAEKLRDLGFWIWYDEFALEIGDSLRRSIDKGLVNSRYGIVVLSPAFFRKEWPQYELNGLTAREIEGRKVILPVWHQISKADILRISPPLADKIAANTTTHSLDEVAKQLAIVLAKEQE